MENIILKLNTANKFDRICPIDDFKDRCKKAGASSTVVWSDEEFASAAGGCDVLVATSLSPKMVQQIPNLKWLHAHSAGVEAVLIPEFVDSPAVLTNSRGTMAPEVAEHAMLLMLALSRGLDIAAGAQREGEWIDVNAQRTIRGFDGSTVIVVGYGAIGRRVAQRARAMGARVVAVDARSGPGDEVCHEIIGVEKIETILPDCDFLIVTLPLTPKTRGLIGEREIGLLPRSSYLINVSRGAVVDMRALIDALESERLAGAACDVFPTEPLPSDDPAWQMENLIITPHIGGMSDRVWPRIFDLFFENLARLRGGKPLVNQIDKGAGF